MKALLHTLRKRDPWITSRVLHTIAFRPEYFDHLKSPRPLIKRSYGVAAGVEGRRPPHVHWQGLYRLKTIPKAYGSFRKLYVPAPPLKRIQRAILRLLNRMKPGLPKCVFGCRHPQEASIFAHASRHMGQLYAVSLDLKDFYTSVTTGHIVRALIRAGHFYLVRSTTDSTATPHQHLARYPWTGDAATLIAGLVTHRHRLPQGAPTSPAMANLAFSEYDERIRKALGTPLVYTRYVDDITISVSPARARELGISSEQGLGEHVRAKIQPILQGSGFELNPRKTRHGNIQQGFRITGLHVTETQIDLPRKTKRRIRATIHQLGRHSFVEIARKTYGGELDASIELRPAMNSHFREERRLSMERLAVLMLRRVCPDLHIRYRPIGSTAERWGQTSFNESFKGKRMWRLVERLLSCLWQRQLQAVPYDDGLRIVGRGWDKECILQGTHNLEFFRLTKHDAFAVVELYTQQSGMAAYLQAARNLAGFESIAQLGRRLSDALSSIEMDSIAREPELSLPEPGQAGPVRPLLIEEEIQDASRSVFELLREYRVHIIDDPSLPIEWSQHERVFTAHKPGLEALRSWLISARWFCIEGLPKLPAVTMRDGNRQPHSIFQVIRLLCDRYCDLRAGVYDSEYVFLGRAPFGGRWPSHEHAYAQLKRAILADLMKTFTETHRTRRKLNPQDYQANLVANPWRDPVDRRLSRTADRFQELHERSTSRKNEPRLFIAMTTGERAACVDYLRQRMQARTSREAWCELFECSKRIVRITTEALDPISFEGSTDEERVRDFNHKLADRRLRQTVWLTYLLRCGSAHTATSRAFEDWKRIQGHVARLLERRWSASQTMEADLFHKTHLELTELEATEVKLYLVQDWVAILKRLLPSDKT